MQRGDAEARRHRQPALETGRVVGGGIGRKLPRHQVHGRFAQSSRGRTGRVAGVALDAPIGGVACGAVHTGERQRAGVHPGGMSVCRGEVCGAIGHEGIEECARWIRVWKNGERPTSASNPWRLRLTSSALGHDATNVVELRRGVEIALAELDPARDRVDVGVLKTGKHHAPREAKHPGARSGEGLGAVVGADVDDSSFVDDDRLRSRLHAVDGINHRVEQNEVGGICGFGRAGREHRKHRDDQTIHKQPINTNHAE